MRIALAFVVLLGVLACGQTPSATSAPGPASPEEVMAFCERYDEVRSQSRQEIMHAVLEVSPPEIYGAVKRASELNSSFEDDAAIDSFIDRCGGP